MNPCTGYNCIIQETKIREVHAMKRLPRSALFENETSSIINTFFVSFNIGALLKKVGAYKTKGIPVVTVFQQLFALVFIHKSLFQVLRSGETAKSLKILSTDCSIPAISDEETKRPTRFAMLIGHLLKLATLRSQLCRKDNQLYCQGSMAHSHVRSMS
jgi:hypothetical protein